MAKLSLRLPNLGDTYDRVRMRELVRNLETSLAEIDIDRTIGAYSVTTDATLTALDDVILVDTSSGDVTVTLPEISDNMVTYKQEYEVVKLESANTLYVDTTGGDTICGEPDAIVTEQWTALRFRATPGNWVVI